MIESGKSNIPLLIPHVQKYKFVDSSRQQPLWKIPMNTLTNIWSSRLHVYTVARRYEFYFLVLKKTINY